MFEHLIMTPPLTEEREAFEAWCKTKQRPTEMISGTQVYRSILTEGMWHAWQAGIEWDRRQSAGAREIA